MARDGRASEPCFPATTVRWRRALSAAYSLNDKTIFRGGVGRSFGRVTVVQGSSHFAGFIGQYVFCVGRCRGHARVQSGSGSAGLSAAAADRSDVLEQQRRGLVQRSGRQPSGAVRQLDDVGSARGPQRHDRRARLQRCLRIETAGGLAQSQSGADVGRERSDCQVRPDRRARPAQLANHVRGGGGRRHQAAVCQLHQSRTCSAPGRSRRRCGRIRNTSR